MDLAFGRIGVVVVSLAASVPMANAAAPLAVDGWHYVEGPNNLHVYVCDRADCVRGSRVFWRFDPLNSAPFPGIMRKDEAVVSGLLNEPSKAFPSIGIVLGAGGGRGVTTSSDGSKTYYEFDNINGPKSRASLSSASPDEKASKANLQQFEAALGQIRN
jgi:hypothetical protein